MKRIIKCLLSLTLVLSILMSVTSIAYANDCCPDEGIAYDGYDYISYGCRTDYVHLRHCDGCGNIFSPVILSTTYTHLWSTWRLVSSYKTYDGSHTIQVWLRDCGRCGISENKTTVY